MKSVSLASDDHLSTTRKPGVLDDFARRMVFKQLGRLETGSVRIVEGEQSITFGEAEQVAELSAKIEVIDAASDRSLVP